MCNYLHRLQGVSPASGTGSAGSRSEQWPLKRSKSSTKDDSPVSAIEPTPEQTTEHKVPTATVAPRETKLESPHDDSRPDLPRDESKVASSPSRISAVAAAMMAGSLDLGKGARPTSASTTAAAVPEEDSSARTMVESDAGETAGAGVGDGENRKDRDETVAPVTTVGNSSDLRAAAAAAVAEDRRAKEKAESEEAARRVDSSTGMMRGLTLADLIANRDAFEGRSGGGSSNFDITVSGSGVAAAAPAPVPSSAASAAGTEAARSKKSDYEARSSASPETSNPPSAAAAPAPAPSVGVSDTPIVASPHEPSKSIVAARKAMFEKKPEAIEVSSAKASDVSSARVSGKSITSKFSNSNASKFSSSSGSSGRGYGAVTMRHPDTPTSGSSGAKAADQAKVFRRLCVAKSPPSEAEGGDAGAGVGGQGAARRPEPTLTFDQVNRGNGRRGLGRGKPVTSLTVFLRLVA